MTSTRVPKLLSILDSTLFKDVPDQLMDNLYRLGQLTKQISQFAPSYDYGDLKFNGCRSLLRIVDRIVPVIKETLLSTDDQLIEALIEVTDLLVQLSFMVVDLHHTSFGAPAKGSTTWHLNNFISSRSLVQEKIKTYWRHFSLFYIEPQSRSTLRFYALFAGLISGLPGSLSNLISRNTHYSRMSDLLYQANAFFPLSMLNAVNNPLTSAISTLHSFYHRTEIKKLTIPRQTDWIIPKMGDGRVTFCPTELLVESGNNSVTCRLLTYTGLQPSGDLVFHVRGGAFVIDVPLFHDTYLMEWIPHLNGSVILDVDYTRAVRYPVALQELLDLYLWLVTQTSEVTAALGFMPRNIVFCGDSGGAYLLLTLAAVLRDIQRVSQESVPIFPTSLVGFYPLFSFNHEGKIPSLVMGFLDAFLNLNTVYQGLSLYASGVTFNSDCEQSFTTTINEPLGRTTHTMKGQPYNHDNNNNQYYNRYSKDSQWERFYNTWFNSESNWYACDRNEFDRRSSKIVADSMLPYISPMVSYDINTLDDLSIYLVVGEFDPFLDMSLDYAKHWKGKVKVDILPDLPHGFLNMTHFSATAHEGSKVCLKRLTESLNR